MSLTLESVGVHNGRMIFCLTEDLIQSQDRRSGVVIEIRFQNRKFLGSRIIMEQPLRGCSYKLSMLLTSLSSTNPPSGLVTTPTVFPLHRYKNLPPDHQSHKFAYNITQTHRIAHVSICMFRYGSYKVIYLLI